LSYCSLWLCQPSSVYADFFNVVDKKGNNIYVKCKLCSTTRKPFSTARTSTSNLKKHMEVTRMHVVVSAVKNSGPKFRGRKVLSYFKLNSFTQPSPNPNHDK